MRRAEASLDVPGLASEAEALWYDPVRWPASNDGFAHAAELGDGWPAELQAEALRLKQQVDDGLDELTRRLFGRASASASSATRFAVIDIPFAAVRRHVAANEPPPPAVDRLIEPAYLAVVRTQRKSRRLP